jgi:DNA-binding MarR family transcriptional regulator
LFYWSLPDLRSTVSRYKNRNNCGRLARTLASGGCMSLRALRYLIALAECLNFTRAAERCSVTQSTLSIQLRKLEDYLGVTLFDRDRAHVALTAEGQQLLRFARVAVRATDRMVATSRAARRSRLATHRERLIEEINCEAGSRD